MHQQVAAITARNWRTDKHKDEVCIDTLGYDVIWSILNDEGLQTVAFTFRGAGLSRIAQIVVVDMIVPEHGYKSRLIADL